ncbi:hypothetical protein OSB04_019217 [Centaurea solstitialis]|uniref:Uncharacterized protein n=1 Tax=Centaurea solstitialis TaxID=347529 RepID=A0AA38SPW6_9ASTR|nr:hypothetical protein OSB04_019217 [Centaurea solstitialis]
MFSAEQFCLGANLRADLISAKISANHANLRAIEIDMLCLRLEGWVRELLSVIYIKGVALRLHCQVPPGRLKGRAWLEVPISQEAHYKSIVLDKFPLHWLLLFYSVKFGEKWFGLLQKEILKWLDAGIIYPIASSTCVSPVQCVPKKGGVTVVPKR